MYEVSGRYLRETNSYLARILLIVAATLVQLVGIAYIFQIRLDFQCDGLDAFATCMFFRNLLGRALAIFTVFAIYIPARASSFVLFAGVHGQISARWRWMFLQLLGTCVILVPAFFGGENFAERFAANITIWAIGAVAATAGTLLWIGSLADWKRLLTREGVILPLLVIGGFFLPDLIAYFDRFWSVSWLAGMTFDGVVGMLGLINVEVFVYKPEFVIGVDEFLVIVGDECSGVQGIALITGLVGGYLALYRKELRFPHALILLPVGIVLSVLLNMLRIAALIWIGAYVSPDLALNGFHSHAGWLLFTLLSLGLIGVSRALPFFRAEAVKSEGGELPPIFRDPDAARIVPFIVFMASSMIASTFAPVPGVWYPLRAIALGAVLLTFLPLYRKMDWRLDGVALLAGAVIGLGWIATHQAEAGSPLQARLAEFSAMGLFIWALFRIVGTTLLVPITEELFFRDYLLKRVWKQGFAVQLAGVVVTSALFAVLHDRWLAGFIAGVVFALLVWRSGRIASAVQAHVIANALIAAWALANGDWSVI